MKLPPGMTSCNLPLLMAQGCSDMSISCRIPSHHVDRTSPFHAHGTTAVNISSTRAMRRCLFLLAAGLTTAAAVCIEGGVSENDRLYVPDLHGKNASLVLLNFDWDSARLVADLVHILLEEALGYHVASEEIGAAPPDYLPRLSGCSDMSCNETNDQDISDIVLNVWYSDSAGEIRQFTDANLNRAPEDLGSIGRFPG